MIFKPSEVTPLTALKLAEIYTEAGVPDGVFNVLTGSGREVGQWLTEHPLIEKISFTGGTSTGKKVMASASSSSLKEVTMELGGKSPLIIFPDADLDRAADIAVMANFFSSGQVCTNGTRVFIHRSQQARFEAKILERVQRIRLGDPQDENTNFGPLVSFPHMESVLGYIESGKAQKARLLCGGERVTDGAFGNGAYVAPTVFTDCRDDMTIVREEIFGPVMSILVYDDEDEAIRRANDTEYGLAAGVVTQDLARAHRAIHRLEAGICWINTWASRRRKCRSAVTSNPVSVARTVSPPWLITLASSPCKWSWATTPRCSEPRRSARTPNQAGPRQRSLTPAIPNFQTPARQRRGRCHAEKEEGLHVPGIRLHHHRSRLCR